MKSMIALCSVLGLLMVTTGCDDSDGVKPGQDSRDPVAEVQRKSEASGGSSQGLSLQDRLDAFERSVVQLGERLDAGAQPPELEQTGRQLTNQAAPILNHYARQNPECTQYLSQSKGLAGRLGNISMGELRRDYAEGGILPDAPEKCRRVQQLLVRPAAIVVMVRNASGRQAVASEQKKILEGIKQVKSGI